MFPLYLFFIYQRKISSLHTALSLLKGAQCWHLIDLHKLLLESEKCYDGVDLVGGPDNPALAVREPGTIGGPGMPF